MGKILNYGSINIDEFFAVPHICRSGETMSSTDYFVRAGGKGANQSVALAKAHGNVYHAGKVGKDAVWNNGRAFIQLSAETNDNCIVLFPGTNGTYTVEQAAKVLESFGPGDWIVQQNEISHGGEIMQLAIEKGLSVFFNPAPLTKGILNQFPFDKVAILVVNETEGDDLYNELGGQKKVTGLDLATELLNHFSGMKGIILTLGGQGLVAKFRHDGAERDFHVPSRKVAVKDTTGAGDTFVGYFLSSFVREEKNMDYFARVQYALEEATFAASIAVSRPGAMISVPTLEEVREQQAKDH
ncbi:Ribokinase-like protein [Radiomyces spectabilis]|uniref:Ribokinase-like protein n=1 Tax=Radiomyces spectabilis TaxID=64574 RepID=UPI00221EBFF7|nr:Ribokinase-like protein [Radiomyces spectabilis]KAI8370549.1 Ribokinase-like protein [Radiomyces spectabilis]